MFSQILHYTIKVREELDKKTYRLVFIGMSLLLLSAIGILFLEPGDQFKTFSDALWWAVVTTTTVGYGDIYPKTLAGRGIAILLMTLGIGTMGGITAKLADVFIAVKRRKERGEVVAEYENHLVICGWNEKTKEIVNQILNENVKYKRMVLVADVDRDPFPEDARIHFVSGKMENKEILEKAGIPTANAAIVLNKQGNDAETVLTILNIENLNPNIYTIAEITDRKHEVHLKNANIDEIIINNDINSQLLVRSALYGGTSKVVKDLLSNEQGNEIYMWEVDAEEAGKNFFELFLQYKQQQDIILIGIKRGQEVITNPEGEQQVAAGDSLIYIAEENIKAD